MKSLAAASCPLPPTAPSPSFEGRRATVTSSCFPAAYVQLLVRHGDGTTVAVSRMTSCHLPVWSLLQVCSTNCSGAAARQTPSRQPPEAAAPPQTLRRAVSSRLTPGEGSCNDSAPHTCMTVYSGCGRSGCARKLSGRLTAAKPAQTIADQRRCDERSSAMRRPPSTCKQHFQPGPPVRLWLGQWRSPNAWITSASNMRARHCKRRGRIRCRDLRSRCRVAFAFSFLAARDQLAALRSCFLSTGSTTPKACCVTASSVAMCTHAAP